MVILLIVFNYVIIQINVMLINKMKIVVNGSKKEEGMAQETHTPHPTPTLS